MAAQDCSARRERRPGRDNGASRHDQVRSPTQDQAESLRRPPTFTLIGKPSSMRQPCNNETVRSFFRSTRCKRNREWLSPIDCFTRTQAAVDQGVYGIIIACQKIRPRNSSKQIRRKSPNSSGSWASSSSGISWSGSFTPKQLGRPPANHSLTTDW